MKPNRRVTRPAPEPPIAHTAEIVPRDSGMPFDLDGAVRAVSEAIQAGAGDLRAPLFDFIRTGNATPLRLRLLTLSLGVEEGPHAAQTYPARVIAAKRALECWGPA